MCTTITLQLKSGQATDHPIHRTSYNYQLADWDSFHNFLRDAPWPEIFAYPVD